MPRIQNSIVAMEQEYRRAEHEFNRGHIARALPHYRRALLIDPESAKLQLRIAQCQDRLGRAEESYATLGRILERGISRCEEPLQREILLAFSNVSLKLGKDLEIIAVLEPILPLVEQTPALFYNLGMALYKSGRHDDAGAQFERLRAIHPASAAGYVGQAILLCHSNRYQEAVEILRAARTAAPADAQIVENLAVVLMKIGNPLGAVAALKSAIKQFRKNARLLHLLGMAHLRLGNLSLAEAGLAECLKIERCPEALREMGWLKVARGDYTGAMEFLKEALTINPNDIWAKVDLAVAYFKQGSTSEAQLLFEEARAASPTAEVSKLLDDLAKLLPAGPRPL